MLRQGHAATWSHVKHRGEKKNQNSKIYSDLIKILGSDTSDVTVAAQYSDSTQRINVQCATSKAGLTALAEAALKSQQLDAAALEKLQALELACSAPGDDHKLLTFSGKTLSATCSPRPGNVQDPTPPTEPPSTEQCDDLNALLAAPLKFLLGATLCVGGVGRFELHKVDVAPALGGKPLTVSGAFRPERSGAGFELTCTLGSAFTQKLIALAQSLDLTNVDLAAFRDQVQLRCVDANNQHLVTIDKNNVDGLSVDQLKQTLAVAGVDVHTFKQVYQLIADKKLVLGQFTLEDGVLRYPGGQIDIVSGAVDFLSDNVAVNADGDRVISIVTERGTVRVADGVLTLTRPDGTTKEVARKCERVAHVGGTITAVCDGVPISFRPGFLLDRNGELENVDDGKPQTVSGAIQIPAFCRSDAACRARIESALIASAKAKGCDAALAFGDDGEDGIYKLSCGGSTGAQAEQIVDDVLLDLNFGKTEDQHAALVDVPKKPATTGTPASALVLSSLGALLAVLVRLV